MPIHLRNVGGCEGQELGESCHRTTHHKINWLDAQRLCPSVNGRDIFQPQIIDHGLNHLDLFPDAVAQNEFRIRMQDGQRDARKTTTRPDVQYPGARQKPQHCGHGQRMQNMSLLERLEVLSGDHIDLRVPIGVQRLKTRKQSRLTLLQHKPREQLRPRTEQRVRGFHAPAESTTTKCHGPETVGP